MNLTAFDKSVLRIPQYSEAFEKNVIGSAIIDPECGQKLLKCREDYFFCDEAKAAFRAIVAEVSAGNAYDTVLILSKIPDKKIRSWVFSANNSVQTTSTFDFYVAELRNLALKRELARVGMSLQEDSLKSPEELAAEIRAKIDEITRTDPNEKTKYEKLSEIISDFEAAKSIGCEMDSPWPELNSVVSGFKRKQLYVLGGWSGKGKTGMGIQLSHHVASVRGKKVLFISLEMPQAAIVGRLFSSMADIESWRIQKPWHLTESDFEKMREGAKILERLPLKIVDGIKFFSEILTEIANEKPDMVIVDHIQETLELVREKALQGRQSHEVLNHNISTLYAVAKKNNFCLVLLSQLQEPDPKKQRPTQPTGYQHTSGLRQKADVGLAIFHPNEEIEHCFELWVKKNRHGVTGGKIKMTFNADTLKYTEFYDIETPRIDAVKKEEPSNDPNKDPF